jgi:8-oxo-dGTP pyrophosphatase MutT (NUDIX family)
MLVYKKDKLQRKLEALPNDKVRYILTHTTTGVKAYVDFIKAPDYASSYYKNAPNGEGINMVSPYTVTSVDEEGDDEILKTFWDEKNTLVQNFEDAMNFFEETIFKKLEEKAPTQDDNRQKFNQLPEVGDIVRSGKKFGEVTDVNEETRKIKVKALTKEEAKAILKGEGQVDNSGDVILEFLKSGKKPKDTIEKTTGSTSKGQNDDGQALFKELISNIEAGESGKKLKVSVEKYLGDITSAKGIKKIGSKKLKKGGQPKRFWGNAGAGVLVIAKSTGRFLLLERSEHVFEPLTWGIVSGKIDDSESPKTATLREFQEETKQQCVFLKESYVYKNGNFTFYNYIGFVEDEFKPILNWENIDYKWCTIDTLPSPLHFGVIELLKNINVKDSINKITKLKHGGKIDSVYNWDVDEDEVKILLPPQEGGGEPPEDDINPPPPPPDEPDNIEEIDNDDDDNENPPPPEDENDDDEKGGEGEDEKGGEGEDDEKGGEGEDEKGGEDDIAGSPDGDDEKGGEGEDEFGNELNDSESDFDLDALIDELNTERGTTKAPDDDYDVGSDLEVVRQSLGITDIRKSFRNKTDLKNALTGRSLFETDNNKRIKDVVNLIFK